MEKVKDGRQMEFLSWPAGRYDSRTLEIYDTVVWTDSHTGCRREGRIDGMKIRSIPWMTTLEARIDKVFLYTARIGLIIMDVLPDGSQIRECVESQKVDIAATVEANER